MNTKLTPALRPMLPADAQMVAAIFRASIAGLTEEDYSDGQREVWAASAEDETAFAAKLMKDLTLIATVERVPAGFASLKDNAHIEMLYVRPEFAGRGIANALLDALETLAAARGTSVMTTDASDTARDVFAKRGYVAQRRNTVELGGEWLGNTTMERRLPAAPRGTLQ